MCQVSGQDIARDFIFQSLIYSLAEACFYWTPSAIRPGLIVRKPVFGFQTWADKNQAVQPQNIARGLKFRI